MFSCHFWLFFFFFLAGGYLSELFSQSVNVAHVVSGYLDAVAKAEGYGALAAVRGTAGEDTTWSLGAL